MTVRPVVTQTLRLFFDRAAENFRKEPAGDHYFDTLQSTMIAMQYAAALTDEALGKIVENAEPRYFVRDLCLHREQEKHLGRW
jgi:hypothetical protein